MHRISGYIAGRFVGAYQGKQRALLVIQTRGSGAVIVPEGTTIPMSKDEILAQAALDLDPVIATLLEGGLSLDDIACVVQRALDYTRSAATR